MRGRSRMRRDRFGREPYLRVRRPQRREQIARAAGRHVRACTASNGSDDGAPIGAPGLACVAAMRRRRPISIETKKPAADLSARVNQTRLDDGIMPVFCPTCQTNEFARAALGDQEDRQMTRKMSSQDTSRNLPGREPRFVKVRDTQEAVVEDAGETGDKDRDLVHGEGGTIDLPTRPGDLSKDD